MSITDPELRSELESAHPFDITQLSKRVFEEEKSNRPRRNSRTKLTIQAIIEAAEKVILESGVERVSILNVCREAKISRGTFYRYFSCQNELLVAYSSYNRERFHQASSVAMAQYNDPHERFDAFIKFVIEFMEVGQARQLLRVAPVYAIEWFQGVFEDSISRFQEELHTVFDEWDQALSLELDRALICEMFIRYILSEQLVPSHKENRLKLVANLKHLFKSLVGSIEGKL